MTYFDQITGKISEILATKSQMISQLDWMVLNRDLLGRVRMIVPSAAQDDPRLVEEVQLFADTLASALDVHATPGDRTIIYEDTRDDAVQGAVLQPFPDFQNVVLADRLVSENDWTRISEISRGAQRIVFFSIKGGVGRSTALAATAWSLAQLGKRVLVLDLDLESPGLSTSLLPDDRQPKFGITDWLVEDLVGQGDAVVEDMVATSELSRDGEIYVVPAHGRDPGEYVAKLGRVWMPKTMPDRRREAWTDRLCRLIAQLEERLEPDAILIDSRAGIDDVAASCVTGLGAGLVLLFAVEGSQTWSGYKILFDHWNRHGVALQFRERLQIVGGLVPEDDRVKYLLGLRGHAHGLFEDIYDPLLPGEVLEDQFNFEESDDLAPHHPFIVRWHRNWANLMSLHDRLVKIDAKEVNYIFGDLITFIDNAV